MAIKVQSANNTIRVGVSTGGSTGGIQVTSDRSSYYSDLARDWAIKMDGKVQEEDYSSKYYAQQSSYSADNAMELVAGFDEHVANKTNDFDQHAQSKIDEAEIWAEGTDEQVQALGGEHSAKGWAEQGGGEAQIQSDFAQTDNTQVDYIRNKPENITTQGNEFNLANQLVQLDSEGRLPSIDGSKLFNLQAYTEAETDLLLNDKQDKLTAGANITIDENNVISAIGGESDVFGIKGDYSTRYGIIDCPNGLASYAIGTKDVTFAAGIVLVAPNNAIKITMASEYTYSILGTEDVTLFYIAGDIVEVHSHDVFWQTNEPENGETGYLAWWNGEKWQFKSNDTGNVWRTAIAQPLVNVRMLDGAIVRLDYIGYRVLDDADLNNKADKDLSNITDSANVLMAHSSMPSSSHVDLPLGASGANYIAPADGWVCVGLTPNTAGNVAYISTAGMMIGGFWSHYSGTGYWLMCPVSKNATFRITYSTVASSTYRFVYANGSESEAQ